MSEHATVGDVELKFPLQLSTKKLDAGQIVIEADLRKETMALIAGHGMDMKVTIRDQDDYKNAAEELTRLKAVLKDIDSRRRELTKPLDDEKKRVMDYVRPFTDALSNAENLIKQGLIEYEEEQERKRRLAEAEAEERRRKEQERLEARAEKAEAAGHVEKADALREQAATAVVAAPVPAAPVKAAGISTRKVYSAECVDIKALAKAVVDGVVAPNAIQADQKFLNQMATALKDNFSMPGCKLIVSTSMAARAKR